MAPVSRLSLLRYWKSSGVAAWFFRSGFGYAGFSDLEDFWARSLPDDFQDVFQTTSRKSSDRVFSHVSLS
ncbi:hypothetical protein F2Q70_00029008 [Brassica cretica]|uniref:Uncharacterized protein n=1 Tax=Brassica cretica TaxID=69181 RepID=A0A8S9FG78_BRACR|nr:hypothetical protein F2Q70_00029008 [Brassica cretica]KAF3595135.1 hypothetical protein DY000_02020106 [Brassica cretica]